MTQYSFGAGLIWVTPLRDNLGVAIANPNPIMVGTVQDSSFEVSFTTKELFGSDSQFAKAIARGQGSIKGKVKAGQVQGALWSNLVFGTPIQNGKVGIVHDTVGAVIPATNKKVVTPPEAGVYLNNLGVYFKSNTSALVLVDIAATPATGEYTLNQATGEYTFATADIGKVVLFNYRYTATGSTGIKIDVSAQPMGPTPSFSLDLYLNFEGQDFIVHFYKCVIDKMSMASSLEDFNKPEFDFKAVADEFGNIITISTAS